MIKHTRLFLSVGLAFSTLSTTAIAAGLQVNEHSANGLGRAFAGQAAKPENASVLATNPAAISQFKTSQLSVAASYINPNVDIDGEMQTTIGPATVPSDASEDDIADSAVIPAAFYVMPYDNKWSFGLGAFANYGLSTDYSDDFEALHFADTAEVMTLTINPAASYKVSDTLSLGFGISATYADAEIGTSTPQAIEALTQGAVPGNAQIVKLEGDDWGYGWNVGAFWHATKTTNVALSYRAETKLNLEGDVSSDLVPTLNQGGSLDLNLAAIAELAVDQKINDQWSVQASAVFTEWSTFEKLEAQLDDGTDLLLKEENFDNTWRGSVGVTYIMNNALTLRAGYAYDDGAVSTANRSLSIPDTDRHWMTVGATYYMSKDTTLDVGYAFITGRDAKVDKQRSITLPGLGAVTSDLTADQSATAHIFSLQLNTRI